jgi:hypothetical protein
VKLRVLSVAQLEATESALWYEDQRSGLADEFFVEVEEAFARIRENPSGHSRLEYYSGVYEIRRCHSPQTIVLAFKNNVVGVLAGEYLMSSLAKNAKACWNWEAILDQPMKT